MCVNVVPLVTLVNVWLIASLITKAQLVICVVESFTSKMKVGVESVWIVLFVILYRSSVSGAVVSTTNVVFKEVFKLPLVSLATTVIVWFPSFKSPLFIIKDALYRDALVLLAVKLYLIPVPLVISK